MSRMPASVEPWTRLTPSETMRSASTSRPESVSSSTANFGVRSSIWRISWRFFSPPEKPSFTERSANDSSMRRRSMAPLTSLTQWRSAGASPSIAVFAVRRKLETDTPGTSTGYCIARNRPARARSSTLIARTSSPSSVTVPPVTWYFGWPAIEYASVDLPEPFGPMMAWTSPLRMVRSTPRRIGFGPSLGSTLTCRSRISRVDIRGSPSSVVMTFRCGRCGPGVRGRRRCGRRRRARARRRSSPGRRARGASRAARWASRCAGRTASRAASTRRSSPPPRRPTGTRPRASRRPRWRASRRRRRARRRPPPRPRRRRRARRAAPPPGRGPRWCRRAVRSRRALGGAVDDRHGLAQLALDRLEQTLLDGLDADLGDELREEAAHDEAARLDLGDAAGLQVEELLVVEPAGRRRVARALDLAGLDLEVRHGVRARAVREDEVAVELVRVGALGGRLDEHVAHPHGVRALALQRALVRDAALAARHGVVDEEAVLLVLVRVGEVQADHLDLAALGGELRVRRDAHDVAAERHDHVLEARVATDAGAVGRRVHRAVGPVLDGDHGEVGALVDDDLDRLAERRAAEVVEHDDGLRVALGVHEHVARGRRGAVALDAHRGDVGRDGLLRHRDDGRLLERVPRRDGGAVARPAGGAEALVVAADDRDLHLGRLDDGDAHVAAAGLPHEGGLEQRREARDRREAPLLLAPGGH